jgi:hypothetical protein
MRHYKGIAPFLSAMQTSVRVEVVDSQGRKERTSGSFGHYVVTLHLVRQCILLGSFGEQREDEISYHLVMSYAEGWW